MGLIDKLRENIPCVISRKCSFVTMTLLLGSFFLVEIVVGYVTNSMALIADAFHMLSDVASLVVGFLALQYSTIEAPREVYTYGYARAEVLGALVNAVFLVALCFSIFIEALKRLVILEEIENPYLVLIVGAVGLVVNAFGMFLFHQTGHGHSHGGLSHSHSHGSKDIDESMEQHSHGYEHAHSHHGHGHSHGHGHAHGGSKKPFSTKDFLHNDKNSISRHGMNSHSTPVNDEISKSTTSFTPSLEKVPEDQITQETQQDLKTDNTNVENDNNEKKIDLEKIEMGNESSITINDNNDSAARKKDSTNASSEAFNRSHIKNISNEDPEEKRRFPTKFKSAGQLNIHAVYLHILGDALGSIIVMISALIIIFTEGEWTLYVDPAMSIIMVAIILKTSIPLLIETSKILMNSVPHHIQVNDLKKRLMENIPDIRNVHELHIWQLAGDKIIASAHVKLLQPSEYDENALKIKEFFHHEGIHSTTIQIEYEKYDNIDRRGPCMVVCSLDSACDDMMCCKPEHEGDGSYENG